MARTWTTEEIEDIPACDRRLLDAMDDEGFGTLAPDDQQLLVDWLRARIREARRVEAESRAVPQ